MPLLPKGVILLRCLGHGQVHIINSVATNDINEMKIAIAEADVAIWKQLQMMDVFPNKNKEQFVWRYHGTRFAASKSQLYTQQLHGIDDHFRYHGPQLENVGRCQV